MWAKRALRRQDAVVVLMLHRVLSPAARSRTLTEPAITVDAQAFADMVGHLAAEYDVVDLSMPVPPVGRGKLRVAITFDDGWTDNREAVLSAMSRHRVPMTIFLCPGLMGRTGPFWPERVRALLAGRDRAEQERVIAGLKQHPRIERENRIEALARELGKDLSNVVDTVDSTLDWQQVFEMQQKGVNFGSHTQSHEILTALAPQEISGQLTQSRQELEHTLGRDCAILAYPNGNNSAEVREQTRRAGYRLAFTTEAGVWTADTDPMGVPRINIADDRICGLDGRFSRAVFEFSVFWQAWRAHRRNSQRGAPQADVAHAT